jgi:hypothetical protein
MRRYAADSVERATGFEPATSTLARLFPASGFSHRAEAEAPTASVTSSVTRLGAKPGIPEQNLSVPRAGRDEPAYTEWLAVSGKLVRKEGLEPSFLGNLRSFPTTASSDSQQNRAFRGSLLSDPARGRGTKGAQSRPAPRPEPSAPRGGHHGSPAARFDGSDGVSLVTNTSQPGRARSGAARRAL